MSSTMNDPMAFKTDCRNSSENDSCDIPHNLRSQLPSSAQLFPVLDGENAMKNSASLYDRDALEHASTKILQKLNIKDRTYRFKKYKKCFVVCEAVDIMLKEKLVKTRQEGVRLGIALQKECMLWSHVVDNHLFADKYLFFRLTKDQHSKNDNGDDDETGSSNISKKKSNKISKLLMTTTTKGYNHSISKTKEQLQEDVSKFRFDKATLEDVAVRIVKVLDIKNRTHRFKTYTNCFVASEVVDRLVMDKLVKSRLEGVALGIALQQELNLWHHVVDNHLFSDNYLFFRLTTSDDHDKSQNSINGAYPSTISSESDYFTTMNNHQVEGEKASSSGRTKRNSVVSSSTSYASSDSHGQREKKTVDERGEEEVKRIRSLDTDDLNELAVKIVGGLDIKNRTYRLRTYKRCFVSSEVIDFMIMQKIVQTRKGGVELGVCLQRKLNLWHHVADNHLFADDYLFFRLISDNDQLNLDMSDYGESTDPAGGDNFHEFYAHISSPTSSDGQKRLSFTKRGSFAKRSSLASISSASSRTSFDHADLDVISVRLLEGLDIQTRTHRFKKYKKCFVASEAIDYMVNEGLVDSRKDGVALGRALQMKRDFWQHVVDDHLFDDEYLFFRLTKDEKHGRRGKRTISSKSSNSSHYDSSSGDERSLSARDMSPERLHSVQELLKTQEKNKSQTAARSRKRLSLDGSLCHTAERNMLRGAFMKARDDRCPHLALIGGVSGCGKTMLVRSAFQAEMKAVDCLFATTKFDQAETKRTAPFTAIRELLSDLFKQAESTTPILYSKFQRAIVDHFEDTPKLCQALGQLLTEEQICLLSMMEGKFGEDDAEEEENRFHSSASEPLADDAIKRAINVFFKAVSSVATVILCLDDIMWSDDITLDVLKALLLNSEIHQLFIVTTFRDNEVDECHPLHVWKSGLAANPLLSGSLHSIFLSNLALRPVQEVLSRSLHVDEEDVGELAQLLLQRTHGNLFYLVQLLESLQDLKVLSYNEMEFRWKFSIDRLVELTTLSENVGQLVCSRITSLPSAVQECLKFASCFGSRIDADILDIAKAAMSEHVEDVHECLQYACDEQMLLRISDTHYKFAHDQIQSAALSMISSSSGAKLIETRWRIAKLLLSHPAALEEDELIFACADQALASVRLVDNEFDRLRIAEMSLVAGTRATEMSAFVPASTYLVMGVKVLGGHKAFATHYDLAIKLHSLLARTAYSSGRNDLSQEVAETAVKYSMNWDDKIPPLMTVFRCLLSAFDYQKCLTYGLDLVATLGGEKVPKNPTAVQAGSERKRVQAALKEYSDDDILNLPRMNDKNKERCMSVLVNLIDITRQLNANALSEIIYYRCVWMTLQDGLSKWAPVALFSAAQLSVGRDHDIEEGARFTRLAEDMLYLSPAGTAHYLVAVVKGVVDPTRQHLDLCMTGYHLSMASGELLSACYSLTVYTWLYFYSGLPFEPLLDDLEKFTSQMLEYNQTYFFLHCLPLWQCVLNLSGNSKDPLDVENGEAIKKRKMVGAEEEVGAEAAKSYGMQVAFYFDEIEKATELYHQVVEFKAPLFILASVIYQRRVFFFALICMANVKRGEKRYKACAKKHMAYIKEFVDSGSHNLAHQRRILEAEFRSLDSSSSDDQDLLRNYELALISSTKSGFIPDAALCAYLTAQFCSSRQALKDSMTSYIVRAHELYLTWGATAVASRIRNRYPGAFRDDLTNIVASPSSGLNSRSRYRKSAMLQHQSLSQARLVLKQL